MGNRWSWIGAAVAGLGLLFPVQAEAQDGEGLGCPCPAARECPGAGACPGGCPMAESKDACPMATMLEKGVRATVENTADGAVVRFTAPSGDAAGRDAARQVARHVARMTEEGCPLNRSGKGAARGAGEKRQQQRKQ